MRVHLDAMRAAIAHSRSQLARSPAPDVLVDAMTGYTNLEVADALLGSSCGGRLAPALASR
jgi:hypothetical protein